MRRLAIVLCVISGPALAEPNPQLLRQIEHNLRVFDVSVDTSQLTTAQAAQLHLLLTSDSDKLGYTRTRSRIRAILRQD
ncbi:hypothetical protein AAD018_003165 [Aestuariibius insulae]|uniref:hypothetical protein n=1 Tax=Aestuariibius insulae TaxID=2058287 RepID=UPI00345E80E7